MAPIPLEVATHSELSFRSDGIDSRENERPSSGSEEHPVFNCARQFLKMFVQFLKMFVQFLKISIFKIGVGLSLMPNAEPLMPVHSQDVQH